MDLSLTFLGTAASVPTAVRGTAATLITRGGHRFLVDCGEGTQRQLLRSGIGLVDLDAVFITHLHAETDPPRWPARQDRASAQELHHAARLQAPKPVLVIDHPQGAAVA